MSNTKSDVVPCPVEFCTMNVGECRHDAEDYPESVSDEESDRLVAVARRQQVTRPCGTAAAQPGRARRQGRSDVSSVPLATDFPKCRACRMWKDAGASWPRPCAKHYGGERRG